MMNNVLIVDDEPAVVESLSLILRKGYRVFSATCAEAALNVLKQRDIDVVISDHRMPGMSGADLLTIIAAQYPDTVRMMLTGQADEETASRVVNEARIYRLLLKPVSPSQVRHAVDRALMIRGLQVSARGLADIARAQHARLEQAECGLAGERDLPALLARIQTTLADFEAWLFDTAPPSVAPPSVLLAGRLAELAGGIFGWECRGQLELVPASDAASAIALVESRAVDAVIADPADFSDVGGPLFERAAALHPDAVRLAMTDTARLHELVSAINLGGVAAIFPRTTPARLVVRFVGSELATARLIATTSELSDLVARQALLLSNLALHLPDELVRPLDLPRLVRYATEVRNEFEAFSTLTDADPCATRCGVYAN